MFTQFTRILKIGSIRKFYSTRRELELQLAWMTEKLELEKRIADEVLEKVIAQKEIVQNEKVSSIFKV